AEFMEDCFDFVMRQQCRLVRRGGSHVPADEAEVWLPRPPFRRWQAGLEVIHPCTAALGVTWMPISIERAEVFAAGVIQLVKLDFRVPHLHWAALIRWEGAGWGFVAGFNVNGGPFLNAETENGFAKFEQSIEDAVDGEVGAQFLGIEVI